MSDRDYLYGYVCRHGSLRSCEICDLEAQVRRLQDGIREVARDLDLSDPRATTVHEVKLRDLIGDDDA